MKNALALALLVAVLPVAAQMNKCTGPDGRVSYSDAICPTGDKASAVKDHTSTVPSAPVPRASVPPPAKAQETPDRCPSNSPDNLATPGQEQAMNEHWKCLRDMAKKNTAPRYFK